MADETDEAVAATADQYMQAEAIPKKVRHRKKRLYQAILQQMEFYFSDANLVKDRFLGKLYQDEGCVDLSVFIRFNKVRSLTTEVEDIAKALRNSEMLSITEDGTKVYRLTPVKEKENVDDCTIYVEQLPPDADHDWLRGVFSAYGKVAYVSIPKYRKSGKIKGFGFVEFDTSEEANKTLEAFGAMGCCLPTQIPPEQLCSIATFEQEENNGFDTMKEKVDEAETFQEESVVEEELTEQQSVKKRKRDKESYEQEAEGTEQVIEPIKKRKRKSETEEIEDNREGRDDTVHSDQVEEKLPEKKKKKKEAKIIEDPSTTVSLESTSEVVEISGRKKKRKHSEQTEGGDKPDEKEDATDKEDDDGCRKQLKGEDSNDEQEVEGVQEEGRKKKRNRKRKKKSKNKVEMEGTRLGLRILSKREWKRLRNKYLELQRKKMKMFKQYLHKSRWAQQNQLWREARQDSSQGSGDNVEVEDDTKNGISESQMRTVFTPGVIVHVSLDAFVEDVKKLKADAKVHQDVKYVDVKEGDSEIYLRCSSSEAAKQLVSEKPWKKMSILEGEEETSYWDKIKRDREEKIGKKVRVKHRGRDRLLKKAETALGKHMRFDDLDEQE